MDKLYDAVCPKGHVHRDIFAPSGTGLKVPCWCGEIATWRPSFGHSDAHEIKDPTGARRTFGSTHEMEKAFKAEGCTVMSKKEHETHRWKSQEDDNRPNPQLEEAVRRAYYRTVHGYKDYPEIPTVREP